MWALRWCCALALIVGHLGKEPEWTEPNILLDGTPTKWVKLDPKEVYKDGKPYPPYDDKWKKPDATIVVLAAALRETRMVNTIYQMISKADHPERVSRALFPLLSNTFLDTD
jgi:hypothetical protein